MTGDHDDATGAGTLRPVAPFRDLTDRIVLYDGDAQRTVEILGSGVVVFRLIDELRSEAAVVDGIGARYPDSDEAVREATALVADLVEGGLVARDS